MPSRYSLRRCSWQLLTWQGTNGHRLRAEPVPPGPLVHVSKAALKARRRRERFEGVVGWLVPGHMENDELDMTVRLKLYLNGNTLVASKMLRALKYIGSGACVS